MCEKGRKQVADKSSADICQDRLVKNRYRESGRIHRDKRRIYLHIKNGAKECQEFNRMARKEKLMKYHIRVRAGALIIKNEAVLLVEFKNKQGTHYNLPAGGTEPGETVMEAVRREALEETSAEVEVGPLAFAYERAPHLNEDHRNRPHSIGLMFECTLKSGEEPKMPAVPDPNQTGVRWVPLTELDSIILYPNLKEQILAYAANRRNIDFYEEHLLEKQSALY